MSARIVAAALVTWRQLRCDDPGGSGLSRRSPVRPDPQGDSRITAGVGSLLHELDFRTGARLEAINGVDVSDPERALHAYGSLRDDPLVSVRVRRDGRAWDLLFAFTTI
ncbi:MAG TPA: hypothetical protein ENK57_23195 [Polyangiaceae bacterium]|nr:hypothetical protein [Polyangiaceae bacterium]